MVSRPKKKKVRLLFIVIQQSDCEACVTTKVTSTQLCLELCMLILQGGSECLVGQGAGDPGTPKRGK